ncbi:MAG: RuBisCO large subunit C-terminal-like domain-containing protein [Acidimicrobiia bacterium]
MTILADLGRARPGDGVHAAGDRVEATYVVQGVPDLEAAAREIVVEESTGTLRAGPDAVARVGGEVVSVEEAGSIDLALASAPLARAGVSAAPVGRVTVAWPAENAASLPGLLTMVVGETTERGVFGACRLVRLGVPDALLTDCGGPRRGIDGTRRALGVEGRPVVGAIVKPSTGLGPTEVARVAASLAEGGCDFVKDDELLGDPPHCPFAQRVPAVRAALDAVEDRSGRRVAYAANVTGPLESFGRRLEIAADNDTGMVMLNAVVVGLDVLRWAARRAGQPVFAHRVMGGALTRSAAVGTSPGVLCGLTRVAGADLVQVGGVAGKIFEDDATIAANADVCRRPLAGLRAALPTSGGGQGVGTVAANAAVFGDARFCHLLGSVASDDPDGPVQAVRRVIAAWEGVSW